MLVTASRDTRTARIVESHGVSEADATRSVDEADAARADYLKRFYGVKQELPTQYDIVLNTDRLGIDEAVAVVRAPQAAAVGDVIRAARRSAIRYSLTPRTQDSQSPYASNSTRSAAGGSPQSLADGGLIER